MDADASAAGVSANGVNSSREHVSATIVLRCQASKCKVLVLALSSMQAFTIGASLHAYKAQAHVLHSGRSF